MIYFWVQRPTNNLLHTYVILLNFVIEELCVQSVYACVL